MSRNLNFDPETNILTINDVEGVEYLINGKVVKGEVKLRRDTTVRARARGKVFPKDATTEWRFEVSKSESETPVVEENPGEPNPEGSGPEDVPTENVAGTTPESPQQQAAKAESSIPRGIGLNRF